MRLSQHLDRGQSFGNYGVFTIEGDNHEEIEKEVDVGNTMGETGTGDIVGEFWAGEFEVGDAIIETVVRGIEMEVEIGEIGRKAAVGSNEREARTGNIEREMDVVEAMTNERTMMYAKDVDPIRKKQFSKWYSSLGDG
ncbi:Hypothetical predicted protein [Olea europaea subsp. europaea]|uniref:Uncharacterized protein n=1 Tax=Olea europaea subsp. europaea TaxID=158383 RepID=A0A8S0QD65_OLEEU|nr:Hypothetical predicted protein [Olea europaea subsp. europaea]